MEYKLKSQTHEYDTDNKCVGNTATYLINVSGWRIQIDDIVFVAS